MKKPAAVCRYLAIIIAVALNYFIAMLGNAEATREIALTFDDAPTPDSVLMTGQERTQRIINALQAAKVPGALFFIKADGINPKTQQRLSAYTQAGFHLANHSFSHLSANSLEAGVYATDMYKAHIALKAFDNVLLFHRFPYLHYGKDAADVTNNQRLLGELGYRDGYVTVDNFDWYLNAQLVKAVEDKKTIDYKKARDFYVQTLYSAIEFYDAIGQKALGRSPKHVLLLHENDTSALFVSDLIAHLRNQGWRIITPQQAYTDPIASLPPHVFYKQGAVAGIAHNQGVPDDKLRHPSENTEYLDRELKKANIVQ